MNRSRYLAVGLASVSLGVAFGEKPLEREAFDAQPPAIVQWARGNQPEFAKGSGKPTGPPQSPNMTWHGGPILPSTSVGAIFWGTSWSNASFVGDKITGLDAFYSTVGGSNYIKTNTEYTGPNGTVVGSGVTYLGHAIDSATAAPSGAPSTSAILTKVCNILNTGALSAVANGYYPVYIDTRRGNAGYCAWHSYGSCGGTPIEIGFFFNLDGDAGCNPQANVAVHSQGLSALVNVSGHELSETMTDPKLNAWYDRQGAENSDKCAWTYSTGAGVNNVSFGGTTWRIQGNWSNAAYDANQGYVRGCIDTAP